LPKPLIPIDNKPIIEIIMDEFAKFSINNFYISINYKKEIIKAYFKEQKSNYNIEFIEETKPGGTAGSLKLLEGKIKTTFFVSNCDIIIKDDYKKIYNFHKKNNFNLTLVGSIKHHTIPYGVCKIGNGGILKKIVEKPESDMLINTGMYILSPEVFNFIPKNKFYNMTDLINIMKKNDYKVGVYPISEKSWMDIGEWGKYKSSLVKFSGDFIDW
jgi:NDP-sugar pyrophosphorylase family protein